MPAFTVTQTPTPYLTYTLRDEDASSSLEVVPERGGIVTRWQWRGQEIFYLDAHRFLDPTLSVRGGIPILFPICGNLPDNTYQWGGKTYSLKQHGFARELPWKVVGQDTTNNASLTIELTSNDTTRQVYPFDFQLIFTYELRGDTLRIHQRFVNLSPERMPFSVGFHPYFSVADKGGLAFEIPSRAYFDNRTRAIYAYGGSFDLTLDEIDAAFTEIDDSIASFSDRTLARRVSLHYDDLYSTLVFWTVQGKDFICLEPWSAPRNALNTSEQLTYLDPQSHRESVIEIRVSDF